MQNDIQAALQRLAELAKGRAFHWHNLQSDSPTGWRAIERVELKGQMTVEGREVYHSIAFAADYTNAPLSQGARSLAQAEGEATMMLKLMPMAADVLAHPDLPASVHIGPAANDAVPPAAEGVA